MEQNISCNSSDNESCDQNNCDKMKSQITTEQVEPELALSEIIAGDLKCDLTQILLPNEWILYLYRKEAYKKMANKATERPHQAIYNITTVNDIVYILKLMAVKNKLKNRYDLINNNKINLDVNDYIIMRKGIEPIWEDPRNSTGGIFTIKIKHSKGLEVWSMFIMYMLGETLSDEMHNINGITVSCIMDNNNNNFFSNGANNCFTYIKIWDAKPNRTKEQFIKILPPDIYDQIKSESLQYSRNNVKGDYGNKKLLDNLRKNENLNKNRGGFRNGNRKR